VIIYLLVVLRTRISSVDEVQKRLKIPFVGSIPLDRSRNHRGNSPIVVEKNNNDVMAEAFRSLRTNLQFVMKKTSGKIVMFTSTTSGEGKTFVACNLAVSKALLGKKVLLVGLDIRRPRLAEMFGFDVKAEGITTYLAADAEDVAMLDKFITPSGVVPSLDVLAAGIVPPNPAELLSRSNLDKAMEYLSGKYDYIVLDTAPVGLVSDSFLVNHVADAVVYVLRVDYTYRDDIEYLNSLIADSKLENVSYVVNGEKLTKKTYGYVGYGTSGRRIGYGYAPKI
jgi:capsular exopolysaccharide synthesis family protein